MENPKSRLSLDQSSSTITRSARSSSSNNSSSSGGSSAVQAAATGGAAASPPHHCGGCGKVIKDRYLLQALDSYWHEDCLKCGCCDCRLGEVGSTLYTRANLILCKRDYLRLFGATGNCAACCKMIPAFEMVMRAKNNVYHMECFACHQCHQRFCVGDRFFLCDNKILCEYDYEERIIFANMANNPANLSMIQNQVNDPQGMESVPPSGMRNDCRTSAWNTSASRNPEVLSVTASSARSSGRHPLAPHTQNPIIINNNNINNPHSNNHKQDSPAPEDASSSGYGSPDSGMAEDG